MIRRTAVVATATAVATYCSLLLLCDSARDSHNHDVGQFGCFLDRSRNRMILVYTPRVIYRVPERWCSRAAACSFPVVVVFAAATRISFRCCWSYRWGWCSLSSLAREVRGRLALREGTGHRQSGCDPTNGSRMSCAVLVAGTPKKGQLTDLDARQLLPLKKIIYLK